MAEPQQTNSLEETNNEQFRNTTPEEQNNPPCGPEEQNNPPSNPEEQNTPPSSPEEQNTPLSSPEEQNNPLNSLKELSDSPMMISPRGYGTDPDSVLNTPEPMSLFDAFETKPSDVAMEIFDW
jgi:hypothetical protein